MKVSQIHLHQYEVPPGCQFIRDARVNQQLHQGSPNSLFVKFKNGYLAHFKSEEVAEEMLGELDLQLEQVQGVASAQVEDREVYIVTVDPSVDLQTVLTNIDKKLVELSQLDELPE